MALNSLCRLALSVICQVFQLQLKLNSVQAQTQPNSIVDSGRGAGASAMTAAMTSVVTAVITAVMTAVMTAAMTTTILLT